MWLTRQPREAAGLPASLEIPAGKLDVEGEPPLQTGQRELAEEIGKQAASWVESVAFYTSPGFSDERVWLYLATDLSGLDRARRGRGGRANRDRALAAQRLDEAIAECQDSKSLIALAVLARRPAAG